MSWDIYDYVYPPVSGMDMYKQLEPAVTELKTIDECVSDHFDRSRSTNKPTTIRDMLQWFSVLPMRPAFEPLLEYCESQCKNAHSSIKAEELKLNLRLFCFLCPTILMTIECPGGSDSPFWYDLHRDAWQFYCPVDKYTLFETVNEHIYMLYVHLNFFHNQCKRHKDQGGWQYCKYGKDISGRSRSIPSNNNYYPNGRPCDCKDSSDYLCTHIYYYYGYTYSYYSDDNDCPSPLRKFLTDKNSHFKHTVKMGFKLSSKPHDKVGYDIYNVLKRLLDPGQDLLTKLCRWLVFISRRPPGSLGDLFAFFYNLPEKWSDYYSGYIKKSIEKYIDDEPGSYEGDKITKAVENLKNSNGSHNNG